MNLENKHNLRREFIDDMYAVGAGSIALSAVDVLDSWGFFTMPASTKYHGTREGDLFLHSKNVAHELNRITKACGVEWANPRSPILVGYFHDLCKCDSYKRPILGTEPGGRLIVDTTSWEYRKDQLLSGHGDKSVMLASVLCKLTEEEMLCIRYHMGAYKTDDWEGYDRAIKKYETVLWTHHADMLASKVVGV
jgi:hypothetical protein